MATTPPSERLKGGLLPNNLDEQLKQIDMLVRKHIDEDRLEARSMTAITSFPRFLDLPPELRNRVYSHIMHQDSPVDLSTAFAPFITAASKQLRAESLSAFFAENTFYVPIQTNVDHGRRIDHNRQTRTLPSLEQLRDEDSDGLSSRAKSSGLLGAGYSDPFLPKWLANVCPRVLLLRNIDLVVTDGFLSFYDGRISYIERDDHQAIISVRVQSGEMDLTVRKPTKPGDRFSKWFQNPIAWGLLLARACTVIYTMARREGFQGFTFDDLKLIAKEFRYWPSE